MAEKTFAYHEITKTYYRVKGANIMLYEPVGAEDLEESQILIATMHGGLGRGLEHRFMEQLAKLGFRTANCVPDVPSFVEQFVIMDTCINFLYGLDGVEKIVLMGQSRGAAVMSGYQKIAENGVGFFQTPDRRLAFPDMDLTPADGIMILDGNYGFMLMHLMSLNPALLVEGNALKTNKALDPLNPANGFAPGGKSHYSEEFRHRFLAAQRARYYRLLDFCEERVDLINKGEGNFLDNEPLVIPDCIGINNSPKLFSTDMSFFAHTKNEWPLLHPDRTITTQIVPSVRRSQENPEMAGTTRGAFNTTVKDLLWLQLNVGEDYDYGEDYITGIDFESSVTCSAGNVKMIHSPLLLMGHTAGYEYINAEWAWGNAASEDKTICFAEGLTHGWGILEPDKYGKALDAQLQYVGNWLMAPGRFI